MLQRGEVSNNNAIIIGHAVNIHRLIQASPYIAICLGISILATLLWMAYGILLQLTLRALLTYHETLFER